MASSTQDEQAHHRKEETEPDHDEADLNIEAKKNDESKHVEDDKIVASESATSEAEKQKVEPEVNIDDDKIVASESATSEQEVKDANQEDKSRGGTMVASTPPPRSLTQEEEEKAREDDARGTAILWSMTNDVVQPKNPSVLDIDDYEEDDSDQTLRFLSRWKAPDLPPKNIIQHRLIEQRSRPIQKQLTTSDVQHRKLSLPRKKFQQLLDEIEGKRGRKETRVSVYGPDGKVHEMWLGDEERSFELTLGWRKFVVDYGLKECCDFVTIWMFRHRDSQNICLAVDVTRFAFRKQVSKRISDAAFEVSD